MGHLPTKSELSYFNDIMCKARKLPEGFTEGMIMRHPSRDIMNDFCHPTEKGYEIWGAEINRYIR